MLWPQIRKIRILRQHARTAGICRRLIADTNVSSKDLAIKPKKTLGNKRIIWQYWAQGLNPELIPEVVKICFDSVDRFCNADEYVVIRLTDSNFEDYLEIPDLIRKNLPKYSKAFFSDFLRCALLSAYGGAWLDATVLLTDYIPEQYWNQELFIYQRDIEEKNRRYWENAYAYYYGWDKRFRVRMLSSVIFSKRDNTLMRRISVLLNSFIAEGRKLPNYFFLQILYNELVCGEFRQYNCGIKSDCIPHFLQQYINDSGFRDMTPQQILKLSSIHKLTYKSGFDTNLLRSIIGK